MYTEDERQIAKALIGNKQYTELIAKVFLESEDKLSSDVILNKTNEQLGEIVRASDLAEQKVKSRFNVLKMLAQNAGGQAKPAAKK